jgi:cytochrome b subunit of formate dehydrogenase
MSDEMLIRFSLRQRLEHLATMIVFTGLCLTGLPQKFYEHRWAQLLLHVMGGIDRARWIHRFFGICLLVATILHFSGALASMLSKRIGLTIVPNRKDFTDAIGTLRYYLGMAERPPRFDRFDYRQKFEYWGLVAGNVIMLLTGLTLYFPTLVTRFLPGQLIPAAKVAHSNEGLMAFLVIIIWHIFNAHLNPDIFPMDRTIFTGRISRHRMEHEHPLELARIEGRHLPEEPASEPVEPPPGLPPPGQG